MTDLDIGILIGVIIAFGTLLWGMLGTGGIAQYINVPSIIIVFGGTIGASLMSTDLQTAKAIPHIIKITFVNRIKSPENIIEQLVSYAEKARRDGLLSLDKELKSIDDDFLKKAVQLLVDGTAPELIRDILETEIIFLEQRHSKGVRLFSAAGALAPAFGFLGTLIGLIAMLVRMNDPETLGPAMAVALVTTLYGVILSNMLFIPLGEKLKMRNEEEVKVKEMIIEGVMSIQSGDNPRIVAEKLVTFLPPRQRAAVWESRGATKPGGKGEMEKESSDIRDGDMKKAV